MIQQVSESATLFLKVAYGLERIPEEVYKHYGEALLVIAGSDRDVTEEEHDWLARNHRKIGAPESVVEHLRKYDYRVGELEMLLPLITADAPNWNAANSLLYDAMRMASHDGRYAAEERIAVHHAARILDVPMDIAYSIEGIIDTEEALRKTRRALFQLGEYEPTEMLNFDVDALEVSVAEQATMEEEAREGLMNYNRALLVIAGADGEVSEAERNQIVEIARMQGCTPEMIEEVMGFDYGSAKLSRIIGAVVDTVPYNFRRMLLFHSIRVARADRDYADAERQAARKAARLLNIHSEIATAIHNLAIMEESLHDMRRALFQQSDL